MEYKFKSDAKAFDLWYLSMYRTYHSIAGVCNIVFTVALILLSVKFWNQADDLFQILMLIGCLLFTVIQPVEIYLRAKKQLSALPADMELTFDEQGMQVSVGRQKEKLHWSKVRSVVTESNMVIVFSDAAHGYMLTNRMLGEKKAPFLAFMQSQIEDRK